MVHAWVVECVRGRVEWLLSLQEALIFKISLGNMNNEFRFYVIFFKLMHHEEGI